MFWVAFYTLFYILSLFFCFLTALADCRCTRSALGAGKGLVRTFIGTLELKLGLYSDLINLYIWVRAVSWYSYYNTHITF
jgi:hypothetical protein